MAELVPHPTSAARGLRLAAEAWRTGGVLAVVFRVEGAVGGTRIPPPAQPRIVHGLWHHTCFEVFVGRNDTRAYHEINLSPCGGWEAYGFRAYRSGGPLTDPSLAPTMRVERGAERFTLAAELPVAALAPAYRRSALRIGLTAVLEADDGTLAYWSLRHPPGRPDFHHADARMLRLAGLAGACEGGRR